MDYVPFNAQEFHRWINDNGDGTLRLNYPLNENSVVIDAGGYEGTWASIIYRKYGCTMHIIEPLQHLYQKLENEYSNTSKVSVYNIAVGGSTRNMSISIEGDSSSLYSTSTNTQQVLCKDVKELFEEELVDIRTIDLFKINIEGGEYELLERMAELNLLRTVKNFQIQFHRFVPDCGLRREAIQKALSKTHVQTWNYDWIWENWELKSK